MRSGSAIIGAPNKDTFRGAVYVFSYEGGIFTQTQKLVASDGTEFNQFGWSVGLSETTALIGSTSATFDTNASQGAVYSFDKVGDDWLEAQKFSSVDGVSGDAFGWSISVDRSTAVIGTGFVTVDGREFQGAAYYFEHTGTGWEQRQMLTASNGNDFDFFGSTVAIERSMILVGAEGAATDGNPFANQGVVYRFERRRGAWHQTQILAARNGASSDAFGHSVALRDGMALIGATGVTVNGVPTAGAAYVFRPQGDDLVQAARLTASDPTELGSYGWSAALLRNELFVGAYTTTANDTERQGAVYVYGPDVIQP